MKACWERNHVTWNWTIIKQFIKSFLYLDAVKFSSLFLLKTQCVNIAYPISGFLSYMKLNEEKTCTIIRNYLVEKFRHDGH